MIRFLRNKQDKIIFSKSVICFCVHAWCVCVCSPEEGIRALGSRITEGCKLGIECRSSGRAARALSQVKAAQRSGVCQQSISLCTDDLFSLYLLRVHFLPFSDGLSSIPGWPQAPCVDTNDLELLTPLPPSQLLEL